MIPKAPTKNQSRLIEDIISDFYDNGFDHRPSTTLGVTELTFLARREIQAYVYPQTRSSMDRIYEILWRTEMFQERGPQLQLHMLEGNFRDPVLELEKSHEAAGGMYEIMDREIWSHLGDDLLKQIFLRLPFESQCRFRVVGKALRSTLPGTLPPLPICAYHNSCPLETNQLNIKSRIRGIFSRLRTRIRPQERSANECRRIRNESEAQEFVQWFRTRTECRRSRSQRKIHQLDLSFAPKWLVANRFRSSRDGLLYTFSPDIPATEKHSSSSSYNNNNLLPPPSKKYEEGGLCIVNPFTKTWTTLPPVRINLVFSPPRSRVYRLWQDWCEVMVDSDSPTHFVVYLIASTEGDESTEVREDWFICRYSSSSGSNDWSIIPGDPQVPFRHESLCLVQQQQHRHILYSWCKGQLCTYDLQTGKLMEVINPGLPSADVQEVPEVEVTEIVEYKGTIFGVMSPPAKPSGNEMELSSVIGISRLGADMCLEQVMIMPDWAMNTSDTIELQDVKDGNRAYDQDWIFLDHAVVVVGDYICFKLLHGLVHGGHGRRVVSQSLVGFHVPSETWRTFDLLIPHLLGATDLEVFEPKCLHVYL